MVTTICPGSSHSPLSTGTFELVLQEMTCAPRTTSRGSSTATTSNFSPAISLTNAARCAGFGLNTLTRLIGRTAQIARQLGIACMPVPNRPSTSASSRAASDTASAVVAPTRSPER